MYIEFTVWGDSFGAWGLVAELVWRVKVYGPDDCLL